MMRLGAVVPKWLRFHSPGDPVVPNARCGPPHASAHLLDALPEARGRLLMWSKAAITNSVQQDLREVGITAISLQQRAGEASDRELPRGRGFRPRVAARARLQTESCRAGDRAQWRRWALKAPARSRLASSLGEPVAGAQGQQREGLRLRRGP